MLLRDLAMKICFPSIHQSLGEGLSRGRKGFLGLRIVKLVLIAREVDSNLQPVSLLNQPQALSFKTRVHIRKLSTKMAHRIHRLPEELSVNDASLPCSLEHVVDVALRHRHWRRALKRFTPSRQGAGAGTPMIAGQALQGTRTGASPSPKEEPRTDANYSPFMIRGGALGRLVTPQGRSRRKGGKGTSSRHPTGRLTSPAKPASVAAHNLGTLKASDEGEAGGSCFLGDSAGLAGGIMKSYSQEREQRSRNCKDEVLTHLWRSTSYASAAGRGVHCNSETPSSCGGRRSPRGTDPSAQCSDQRMKRMEKHPSGQLQGRQDGRSDQAPPPDGLPRPRGLQPRELQVASPIDDRLRTGFTSSEG